MPKRRDGSRGNSSIVDSSKNIQDAIRYTEFGFRSTIVSRITNVSSDKMRRIWKEVHNRASPAGTLAQSDKFLENHKQVVDASLFLRIYHQLAGDKVLADVNYDLIIRASELYHEYRKQMDLAIDPLSADNMYVLARDLRTGDISFHTCSDCGTTYIHNEMSILAANCPIGSLYRDSCKALPLPYSKVQHHTRYNKRSTLRKPKYTDIAEAILDVI